ncbi:SPOR domain-containing protein [Agrobacterium sp. ES01]|uniref:SPOR domain-containing protein n=1 Tax=Agrobacterium sp. ES01 TaxID=3420714 RepID=UPI003D1321AB
MLKRIFSASLLLAATTGGASADRDDGYWVIVGNLLETDYDNTASEAIRNRVRACGFEPFNDFSAKFSGFRPGFNTFLLGAYETRAEARTVLNTARRCVPDAYIRRGTYSGE